jgi:serine/threonine-protein kinase HipA
MTDRLAIWLYRTRVAIVEEERHRLRLQYTPEARQTYAAGTPLLSLTLPLTVDRFPNGVVRAFLDGLLPEGDTRRVLAEDFSLRANDTFGLIRALGRDCAGALVIQPDAEPAPAPPTTLRAEPLTEAALAELVGNLRSAPLGAGPRVRISLAGVQEKLLLTRLPDGAWGRPVDGTPSTHILKPAIRGYPQTVENEAFCMRLAMHLGLAVAEVETITVAEQRLIVISRYDRRVAPSGAVERIHQEDFCQALAIPPLKKYEEDGGPSLRQIARILQVTNPQSLEALLRATVLNVLIGNGDAHGKNLSLLHEPSGALRLAPLYDLICTLIYGDARLAMAIDNVRRTDRVTTPRLINEAVAWGLPRAKAIEIVAALLAAVPEAVARAAAQTPDLPEQIPALVAAQRDRVMASG